MATKSRKKNQEEVMYSKIAVIVDSFVNTHNISKRDFLKKVFDAAFTLIPEADKGSFYELQKDRYIPIFANGYDLDLIQKLSFDKSEAFADFSCSDIQQIEANEVYIEKRSDEQYGPETIAVLKALGTYGDFYSVFVPITSEGQNVGIICLDNFTKSGFSSISKKILTFYAQMISNFYSQKVHQEKESQMYKDIVTALVSAIEVKDKYTEGHAQRVHNYSCAIAEGLGLSSDQIYNISTAALLHDIGKIGISSEILNKPDKLTEEEYGLVKHHPTYAKQILDKIGGFSVIVDLAYMHHEHYDGSGYPQGLSGHEIPLEAQIIQLADAFDAMTSDRAYRKALLAEDALRIIEQEAGKQFHPELVKVALAVFRRLGK